MSYTVYFIVDLGGPEPLGVGPSLNYTSNAAPMWRAADCDIATLNNRQAGECGEILGRAIQKMEGDPEHYKKMNPANGWGDYDGCLEFLKELHEACAEMPKATVKVWC